jgi:hypothetical protein
MDIAIPPYVGTGGFAEVTRIRQQIPQFYFKPQVEPASGA